MKLREQLSKLEHQQWKHWSTAIAKELRHIKEDLEENDIDSAIQKIESRLRRWKENWAPYERLSEETKEFDRVWADKIIEMLADNKARLLLQKQHDYLVEDLGFKKVKTRCPVCYTLDMIQKNLGDDLR